MAGTGGIGQEYLVLVLFSGLRHWPLRPWHPSSHRLSNAQGAQEIAIPPPAGPLTRACTFGVSLLLLLNTSIAALPQPVRVREQQGSLHAFLLLRSAEGQVIALGDLLSVAHGDEVHSRLTFHFRDGSIDDETTVYRQRTYLQLLSDHHIQRGPSYPDPLDISLNTRTGNVTSRTLKDGKTESKTEHMNLPPDLANGILAMVLTNFPAGAAEIKVSYIATDPKPRLVAFSIKPEGRQMYEVSGARRQSTHYTLHVEIGGIAGMVAPLLGKQPEDTQAWVSEGEAPTFLRLQGALYLKGPIWTMELTSPEWRGQHR